MIVSRLLEALALPPDTSVDQRVSKKLLQEQAAATAADRRQISRGIEQCWWRAALKPGTIGVPEYRDGFREYLEIAVLTVSVRPEAKPPRLIELIHRAIPYPVVSLVETSETVAVSLAHKRWSQGEAGKTVLDGEVVSVTWDRGALEPDDQRILSAMALGRQPRTDLRALYEGWMGCLLAIQAARITGEFAVSRTAERTAALREGLEAHARLRRELATLRAHAKREKQMNRRVELNFEIKRLEAELAALNQRLMPGAP